MPQIPHLPPVAQVTLTITGVVLAVVRLLTASKAFWWKFPEWLQKGLPAALVALGMLPQALEHAQSWLDVAQALLFSVGAWFTASRGDQRPVEPPKSKAPPSDPDTTVSLMPPPTSMRAPDRSRLHNDAPDEPAEMRGWLDWRWQLSFGVLVACALACSAAPLTSKRCDFTNPTYSAHVASCRQEIAETCLLNEDETPRADCPALVKCQTWREKECR